MEYRRNRKYIWIVNVILILISWLTIGSGFDVYASGEKTEKDVMNVIKEYRNSVVHIEAECWDGREEIYYSRSFSGFVVAEDSSGIYVATICDGLTYTSGEKEKIKTENELENNSNISEKIETVFSGDLRVEASIIGQSEQRNLTILKLNQSINFEKIPSFAKENISTKERIYLLSYPLFEKKEEANYSMENVNIVAGSAIGAYKQNKVTFLKHDIQADEESMGGMLLNDDGMIIGLMLKSKGEKDGVAISGDEIKAFLDTFHINYTEQEEKSVEKKFPIVQIVLAVVILILLVLIFVQMRKNQRIMRVPENTEKNTKPKKAQSARQKQKKNGNKLNAKLVYPNEKREIKIRKPMFVIGRMKEADLALNGDKGISRKHACIQHDGKNFYIIDLKSTNHTYLNGEELNPGKQYLLKDKDEIQVAKEKLLFRSFLYTLKSKRN